MSTRDERRPFLGRMTGVRAAGAIALSVAVAAACTGENLFTGPGLGGGTLLGPTVEITEPADAAALTQGDSVQVDANITSDNGVNEVILRGVFTTGTNAYIQEIVTLTGATDTTVSTFLQPAGTNTGAALIIVSARDVTGNDGADTVSVTIN